MKATNFNTRVDKTTALILINQNISNQSGTVSIADILNFEVMNKEYGDDDDWIGITHDDIDMIADDTEYKTFELWGIKRPVMLNENVIGYSVRAWKDEEEGDITSIDVNDDEANGFGIYADTENGLQAHVIDFKTREQAQHIADTLTELLNTLPE